MAKMNRSIGYATALILTFVIVQADAAPKTSSTPCMDALHLFTGTNVPTLSPGETEVSPGNWKTNATPPGLPGKGLAQHPMLYVGEGYNKIFVVNEGKIIWTYSTGKGW